MGLLKRKSAAQTRYLFRLDFPPFEVVLLWPQFIHQMCPLGQANSEWPEAATGPLQRMHITRFTEFWWYLGCCHCPPFPKFHHHHILLTSLEGKRRPTKALSINSVWAADTAFFFPFFHSPFPPPLLPGCQEGKKRCPGTEQEQSYLWGKIQKSSGPILVRDTANGCAILKGHAL